MKSFAKLASICYIILASIAAIVLAMTFFVSDAEVSALSQVTLLFQAVAFSYIGGLYGGMR